MSKHVTIFGKVKPSVYEFYADIRKETEKEVEAVKAAGVELSKQLRKIPQGASRIRSMRAENAAAYARGETLPYEPSIIDYYESDPRAASLHRRQIEMRVFNPAVMAVFDKVISILKADVVKAAELDAEVMKASKIKPGVEDQAQKRLEEFEARVEHYKSGRSCWEAVMQGYL